MCPRCEHHTACCLAESALIRRRLTKIMDKPAYTAFYQHYQHDPQIRCSRMAKKKPAYAGAYAGEEVPCTV